MATRNRLAIPNLINQENNITNSKLVAAKAGNTKRAALGDLGNKVNTLRGVEPINRSSLLPKEKKKPLKQQAIIKPLAKVPEKSPVQIVKPLVKENEIIVITGTPPPKELAKKDPESFSSDLLVVEDIDEQDKDNPLLISIYSNDIYNHLRYLEKEYPIREGFLKGQEITPKMRCVLVDWLVEVHQQFHLLQETLYLTVAIIDRFLQSFRTIDKKRLQLVGVSAMFIACKYEEMYSPEIGDFVYITDNAYSKTEILQMEMLILKTLDYSIGRPLPLHFLRRYSKAGKAYPIHHTMAKYFLEQSLIYYEVAHYPPSLIAAAAIYFALLIVGNEDNNEGKPIWTNTLTHYSTYTKDQILPVVRRIAAVLKNAEKSKYQAVKNKFNLSKYMRISVRPELKSPIIDSLAQGDKRE